MCNKIFMGAHYIAGTHQKYYHDIRFSDNAKLIPEILMTFFAYIYISPKKRRYSWNLQIIHGHFRLVSPNRGTFHQNICWQRSGSHSPRRMAFLLSGFHI